MADAKAWRCFFCDAVLTDPDEARRHFAADGPQSPVACVRENAETAVLAAHRRATRAEMELNALRAAVRSAAKQQREGFATVSLPFDLWRRVVLIAETPDASPRRPPRRCPVGDEREVLRLRAENARLRAVIAGYAERNDDAPEVVPRCRACGEPCDECQRAHDEDEFRRTRLATPAPDATEAQS